MTIASLHKKIEYYLIENQKEYFTFPIIAEEVMCHIDKENKRGISQSKLDLLGADEENFYIIEIKTRELTMNDINKYEKTYNDFNYLHRDIIIVFVVPSINKKAKEYIEKLKRYKIVYITELEKINNYTIDNEINNKSSCYALDEYKISFLLDIFFKKFDKHICDAKFGNVGCGESFSAITYRFKNNYKVILYIGKDNRCLIDTIFDNGIDRNYYNWAMNIEFTKIIEQIIYIQKLIMTIKKMPNKKIDYGEFMDMGSIVAEDTCKALEDGYNKYKNLYTIATKTFSKYYKK